MKLVCGPNYTQYSRYGLVLGILPNKNLTNIITYKGFQLISESSSGYDSQYTTNFRPPATVSLGRNFPGSDSKILCSSFTQPLFLRFSGSFLFKGRQFPASLRPISFLFPVLILSFHSSGSPLTFVRSFIHSRRPQPVS